MSNPPEPDLFSGTAAGRGLAPQRSPSGSNQIQNVLFEFSREPTRFRSCLGTVVGEQRGRETERATETGRETERATERERERERRYSRREVQGESILPSSGDSWQPLFWAALEVGSPRRIGTSNGETAEILSRLRDYPRLYLLKVVNAHQEASHTQRAVTTTTTTTTTTITIPAAAALGVDSLSQCVGGGRLALQMCQMIPSAPHHPIQGGGGGHY